MSASQFPINLNLSGRRVLVVGGGRIALRKTEQLLASGAVVTVVAPEIAPEFHSLPVECCRRPFVDSDLDGTRLVITATGVREVDQAVYDGAERRGIWVNSADDPVRCTFTLPATLRRGRLMITSSTNGSSPALSSYVRSMLSDLFSAEWEAIVDELSEVRDEYHRRGVSTETIDWRPVISEALERHQVALQRENAEVES